MSDWLWNSLWHFCAAVGAISLLASLIVVAGTMVLYMEDKLNERR